MSMKGKGDWWFIWKTLFEVREACELSKSAIIPSFQRRFISIG